MKQKELADFFLPKQYLAYLITTHFKLKLNNNCYENW